MLIVNLDWETNLSCSIVNDFGLIHTLKRIQCVEVSDDAFCSDGTSWDTDRNPKSAFRWTRDCRKPSASAPSSPQLPERLTDD